MRAGRYGAIAASLIAVFAVVLICAQVSGPAAPLGGDPGFTADDPGFPDAGPQTAFAVYPTVVGLLTQTPAPLDGGVYPGENYVVRVDGHLAGAPQPFMGDQAPVDPAPVAPTAVPMTLTPSSGTTVVSVRRLTAGDIAAGTMMVPLPPVGEPVTDTEQITSPEGAAWDVILKVDPGVAPGSTLTTTADISSHALTPVMMVVVPRGAPVCATPPTVETCVEAHPPDDALLTQLVRVETTLRLSAEPGAAPAPDRWLYDAAFGDGRVYRRAGAVGGPTTPELLAGWLREDVISMGGVQDPAGLWVTNSSYLAPGLYTAGTTAWVRDYAVTASGLIYSASAVYAVTTGTASILVTAMSVLSHGTGPAPRQSSKMSDI